MIWDILFILSIFLGISAIVIGEFSRRALRQTRRDILTTIDFIKEEIDDQDYDSAYRMLSTLADMVKKI